MASYYNNFAYAIDHARRELYSKGVTVSVGHWQGMNAKDQPHMATHELMNYTLTCLINPDIEVLKAQIKPNLPWADDHFLERVGGVGLNPGEQYKNWPFYVRQAENDIHRVEQGKFSHTYMERIWPNSTEERDDGVMYGIRYRYGDLSDVINLLLREPLTRQAYLPIWFPEDTGSHHTGRVPCTLGYHFMRRNNQLHIWYPIRACDYFRHFRDDIYLAVRLLLWVLNRLQESDPSEWGRVGPGLLTMHIFSFHVFVGEVSILGRGDR